MFHRYLVLSTRPFVIDLFLYFLTYLFVQLQIAADVARVSTASLGKFQPKLPEDKNTKPIKNVGNKKKRRLMVSTMRIIIKFFFKESLF